MTDNLLGEIERRWQSMFAALAAGDDVTPTRRLRTEGMMEAAVLAGLATPAVLVESMDRCYRAVNGRGFDEEFGDDWQDFFPFPQIPAMARRAPVFPSTPD
ncbi:MAG: hypothetical protein R3E50_07635 [Halioglobus sp.]